MEQIFTFTDFWMVMQNVAKMHENLYQIYVQKQMHEN